MHQINQEEKKKMSRRTKNRKSTVYSLEQLLYVKYVNKGLKFMMINPTRTMTTILMQIMKIHHIKMKNNINMMRRLLAKEIE